MTGATHLTTSGSAASASSYATASIAPTSKRLVLVAVSNSRVLGATTPTISGAGMTWEQVTSGVNGTGAARITLFRGLSLSPGSGAITIDFGGTAQANCQWTISEYSEVAIGGSNGADAVVQFSGITQVLVSSLTVNLVDFSGTANATFGTILVENASGITPGTGFTELGEAAFTNSIESEWRNDNDTTVDWTFAIGSTATGIAIEIKNAITLSVSDTATLSENINVTRVSNVTKSDTATLSESVRRTLVSNPNVSDTLTLDDILWYYPDTIYLYERTIVQIGGGGDTSLSVNVSDTATLSENIQLQQLISANVTDTITVSENTKVVMEALITVNDIMLSAESISVELQVKTNVSDSLTLNESTKVEPQSHINVSDNLALSEAVTLLIPLLFIQSTDNITLAEALLPHVLGHIAVLESSALSDTPQVFIPELPLNVSDNLTLSENLERMLEGRVAVSETVTASESATLLQTSFINTNDLVLTGEIINVSAVIHINVSDNLVLSESNTNTLISNINVSDTATIAETITLLVSVSSSVSDSLTITEFIDVLHNNTRNLSVSDSLNFSESTQRLLYPQINWYEDAPLPYEVTSVVDFVTENVNNWETPTPQSYETENSNGWQANNPQPFKTENSDTYHTKNPNDWKTEDSNNFKTDQTNGWYDDNTIPWQ